MYCISICIDTVYLLNEILETKVLYKVMMAAIFDSYFPFLEMTKYVITIIRFFEHIKKTTEKNAQSLL